MKLMRNMKNTRKVDINGSCVCTFDFLAGTQILVLYKKKAFKYFTKSHSDLLTDDFLWEHGGSSSILYGNDNTPYFVMVLREKEKRVVIHECVHMVHQVCFVKGIPVSLKNSETIAYMTDYLCSAVFAELEANVKNYKKE
jgi:hypothetical protein